MTQFSRATYRRHRRPDPLAGATAVRAVLGQLRAALPEVVPPGDKEMVSMLRAVRHIQRYPATDTKRGRPARWRREDLLKVTTHLNDILERETASHISLSSFVDHYLRLLSFPPDVLEALDSGQINLFEAEQLARITPQRLGKSAAQARRMRADLLTAHLHMKLSGERLRRRVAEILLPPPTETPAEPETPPEPDLEDFDPYDPTHLFWDQIKQLGFALREIKREDVDDEEVDELLRSVEPVLNVLAKIQRRRERKNIVQLKV